MYFMIKILEEKNCHNSLIYSKLYQFFKLHQTLPSFQKKMFTGGCKFFNILQLYGLISTFFWMLVEGLNLYLVCVYVYYEVSKFWYYFIGYGIPALIVTIWVVLKLAYDEFDLCFRSQLVDGFQRAGVGPPTEKNFSLKFDSIYRIPIFIVLSINFWILIKIILILRKKFKAAEKQQHLQTQPQNCQLSLNNNIHNHLCKSILTLIPLLGLHTVI